MAVSFAREQAAASAFDPASVLLRVLGLGLTVRALVALASWLRLLRLARTAGGARLELGPEALRMTIGDDTHTVDRGTIAAIRREAEGVRRAGRHLGRVFVVGRDGTHLAIPRLFERSAADLAETLVAWVGPGAGEPLLDAAATAIPDAAETYRRAARGKLPQSVIAFRYGHGWARRGPYAALLLAFALADGALRAGGGEAHPSVPLTLGFFAALFAVPLGWLGLNRWIIHQRERVLFIVTPTGVVYRERGTGPPAAEQVPWSQVTGVRRAPRPSWSVIDGFAPVWTLVVERGDQAPLRFDEAYLAVPGDVAAAQLDLSRRSSHARTERARHSDTADAAAAP
jgi:hypothetical protein